MNKEQILEEQVQALEKLLSLKAAVIQELENRVTKLEAESAARPTLHGGSAAAAGTSFVPFMWRDPCYCNPNGSHLGHEFPPYWNGTLQSTCRHCRLVQYGSGGSNTTTISGAVQNIPANISSGRSGSN